MSQHYKNRPQRSTSGAPPEIQMSVRMAEHPPSSRRGGSTEPFLLLLGNVHSRSPRRCRFLPGSLPPSSVGPGIAPDLRLWFKCYLIFSLLHLLLHLNYFSILFFSSTKAWTCLLVVRKGLPHGGVACLTI